MSLKRFFFGWLLVAFSLAGAGPGMTQPPAASSLEGNWTGTLVSGRERAQVVMTIAKAATGSIHGSVTGIPGSDVVAVDPVERNGNKVKLIMGPIGGFFDATLSDDGNRLTGTWSEIAITQPLEMVRSPAGSSPAAAPN